MVRLSRRQARWSQSAPASERISQPPARRFIGPWIRSVSRTGFIARTSAKKSPRVWVDCILTGTRLTWRLGDDRRHRLPLPRPPATAVQPRWDTARRWQTIHVREPNEYETNHLYRLYGRHTEYEPDHPRRERPSAN